MDFRQMTSGVSEYHDVLPDDAFNENSTIWDQSPKIIAAVINHPNILPDDGENKKDDGVRRHHKKHDETYGVKPQTNNRLTPYSLAELQEEHALWLK